MTASPYEELRRALQPQEWTEQAACVDSGEHPDLWFAPRRNHAQRRRAKAICAACPVADICRADGEGHLGIWGGQVGKAFTRSRQVPQVRVAS